MSTRTPTRPVAAPSRAPGRAGSAAAVILVLAGSALVGLMARGGGSADPEQESALAASVADVVVSGSWPADSGWTGRPPGALLQFVAWVGGTGALGRHDGDPVAAVREVALLAVLAGGPLTWVLARRLGSSRVVATVVAAVLLISPLALLLHRTASADGLASPWLLAACCLALHAAGRWDTAVVVGAALCACIAVLTAPPAVVLLPLVGWMLVRRRARAVGRRRLAVGVLTASVVLGGWAVAVGAARLADISTGPLATAGFGVLGPAGDLPLVVAWRADPLLVLLVLIGALILLARRPSARPVAGAVLGWLVLCAIPGALPPTALVLVLPFSALVVSAAALEFTAARGRVWWRTAQVVPAAAVAMALLVGGAPAGTTPVATAAGPGGPVAASPASSPTAAPSPELAVRVDVGRELLVNPALRVSDPVRTSLAEGSVDPRVLLVLPRAAAEGTLRVDAVTDTDADGLADSVLVGAVDGAPATTDSPVARFLAAQPEPFRTEVDLRGDGLLVTWPGTAPPGLLGSA